MKIILFIVLLIFSKWAYSQDTGCITLLADISVKWRNDSLTTNGFRQSVYGEILKCNFYSLNEKDLLKYLGKPFRVTNWTQGKKKGIAYTYFYWDGRSIPDSKSAEAHAVTFNFDENGKFLYVADNMFCG